MTHDYKAAIEYIDRKFRGTTIYDGHPLLTVYQALRIADKLMQEPSCRMKRCGIDAYYDSFSGIDDVFTAMRDQMLKEIEDEN